MIKNNFSKDIQYLMAFIFYLFSVSCIGPLEGEIIEFITPNVYKDLSPEATRIEMKTKKGNWMFEYVHYNDTIVNIYYTANGGEIIDPSFSYNKKTLKDKRVTEITGSFFYIKSESPSNKNEPTVITVDITENTSKEKRVLLVVLINLDRENYFRIEQNPK